MVGFPHSEIIGSKLIRSSPTLIAAYYVLHRLCTPRHPLNALKTLDRSHYQCPQHQHHPSPLEGSVTTSSGLSIRRITAAVPTQMLCVSGLIGQIKLTRIHVALLFLPGVLVKRTKGDLFTMSKDPADAARKRGVGQTCSLCCDVKLVEPDGIEPTT